MMWSRIMLACLLLALLSTLGCSRARGEKVQDDSRDPAAYACDVKTQVVELLGSAKRDPASAKTSLSLLVNFLDDYRSAPVGKHKQVYAELLNRSRELKQMYEQSAAPANVNAKIDEIVALAERLPGEIAVEPE